MAYNTSKGPRDLGDIKNENDTDTQIDFGSDQISFKTDSTDRLTVTNSYISSSVDVTISGSLRAKSLQATIHNFANGGIAAYFIPFMSTVEATTPTYLDHMVAPAHGRLVKALVRMSGAQAGSVTLDLYKAANGTTSFSGAGAAAIVERSAKTMGSADTTVTFSMTGSEHFGEGNILGIAIDPDAASDNVNVTCVWEYNYIDLQSIHKKGFLIPATLFIVKQYHFISGVY